MQERLRQIHQAINSPIVIGGEAAYIVWYILADTAQAMSRYLSSRAKQKT